MEWIEFIVHTTTQGSDPVSSLLLDLGSSGTMIEDRSDIPDPGKPHGYWEIIDSSLLEKMPEDVLVHAWFPADDSAVSLPGRLTDVLRSLQDPEGVLGTLRFETRFSDDSAWKDIWKKYYKPFRIGRHFVIKPTWESYKASPDDLVIEMDPGMAFGSGTHETTELCITLLEEVIQGRENVIDIGTGSGILAISAAMLGARHVLAIDIDSDAVRVAEQNIVHNHVENVVEARKGDLLKQVEQVCDICVANIISDVIISIAEPVKRNILPDGFFLCSGIVRQRAPEVREALILAGYDIEKEVYKGEWAAFLSRRQ